MSRRVNVDTTLGGGWFQRFFATVGRTIGAFVLLPVAIGALVATLFLPPTTFAVAAVDAGLDEWDAIVVDDSVFDVPLAGHVVLVDRDGNEYARFYAEDRDPIDSLDEVSSALVDAVVATEDREFFDTGALNERGVIRALVTRQGGGSGITQQYAKLLCANSGGCLLGEQDGDEVLSDRSLYRKIVELKYAVALDQAMSREEILTGYLNTAYFGNGAYGVGAAARRYFGVSAKDLDVPQSAMLAGLLKSPYLYDPTLHEQEAKNRRDTVLYAMADAGKISEAEADGFAETEIGAGVHDLPGGCDQSVYPVYCQWVKESLLSDPVFGGTEEERLERFRVGGFTVKTAISPKDQDAIQSVIDQGFFSETVDVAQAVVVPGTGEITAVGSSIDFSQSQYKVAIDGQLQPGSTFKPITLAAALESGIDPGITLSASANYVPVAGSSPPGGFHNNYRAEYGVIDSKRALQVSANTWFVRLAEKVGVTKIADTAYAMGMSSMDPQTRSVGATDLSLTLGTFETTVVDLANVYATLAAGGVSCQVRTILEVWDTETGKTLPAPSRSCSRAISKSTANLVSAALSDANRHVNVTGQDWRGKTGTTDGYGAVWFAGYTANFASALWMGDVRGPQYGVRNVSALGQFYGTVESEGAPSVLWAASMRALTANTPSKNLDSVNVSVTPGRGLPQVVGLEAGDALGVLVASGVDESTISFVGNGDVIGEQYPAAGVSQWGPITLTLVESP